jgi:hypothetical protein
VSTRSVMRIAEWTLAEETAEGATRAMFRMECLACGATSGHVDNVSEPVEMWALKHTGRNLTHRQFKLFTEWFMRVSPAPSNPLYEMGAGEQGP